MKVVECFTHRSSRPRATDPEGSEAHVHVSSEWGVAQGLFNEDNTSYKPHQRSGKNYTRQYPSRVMSISSPTTSQGLTIGCARQILKPECGGKELIETIDKRIKHILRSPDPPPLFFVVCVGYSIKSGSLDFATAESQEE
ncbi:hypothetical protein LguiB_022233 [Lonicera macranthoides]